MIWVFALIGYLALCFVAYAIVCSGGIAERRAERALRKLQADEQLIAETQSLRGDCPWPLSGSFHAQSDTVERQRNLG